MLYIWRTTEVQIPPRSGLSRRSPSRGPWEHLPTPSTTGPAHPGQWKPPRDAATGSHLSPWPRGRRDRRLEGSLSLLLVCRFEVMNGESFTQLGELTQPRFITLRTNLQQRVSTLPNNIVPCSYLSKYTS